jgi:zinc D-Ala-D-Ala dipeptidase
MKTVHSLSIFSCISLLFLLSCGSGDDQNNNRQKSQCFKSHDSIISSRSSYSTLEQSLQEAGLVDIQKLDSNIHVDLKYSGTDNFLKMDVYGDMIHAYLQPDVAQKLLSAQKFLKELHPGFNLVVFDAVRPISLQKVMWDSIKVPKSDRGKYVANPRNGGSLHNYGAAVDASIIDSTGKELDMGCSFDYFGELACPVSEYKFLSSGELNEKQVGNRKLLRYVMSKAGFYNIQTEWWHFNSCTREHAMEVYRLIE